MGKTNFDSLGLETPLDAANIGAQGIHALTHYISGNQTTGTKKWQWRAPVTGTIVGVGFKLDTPPAGAALIVDVNKAGTTLFTSQAARPTAADGGDGVSTTTLPAVVAVAAGDLLSFDVDQIGSGTAGAGLTISIAIKAALVD